MEQQVSAPRRGRPSNAKPSVDKVEMAEAPSSKSASKPKIKRKAPKTDTPNVYNVINGGGMYFKLRSRTIVFDEEVGYTRELRYCPSEKSIWADEQSDKARVSAVIFRDKTLVVPQSQPNLIQYLERHPDNVANGGIEFKLLNETENIQEEVDTEFIIHDAISMVKSRPLDELLPLAMALNIDVDKDNLSIKRDLIRYARSNPRNFMDMSRNPLVEARGYVSQAYDFDIIKEIKGAVVWADTGKMICSVPVGQNRVDVVTRFVMTDQGSSVLAEIERQLSDIA